MISVCHGTACHVKGARAGPGRLRAPTADSRAATTPTPTAQFTIQKVACLGCCTLAPVIQIDGVTYGGIDTYIAWSPRCSTIFSPSARQRRRRAAGAAGRAGRAKGRWARSASAWARAASPREAARSIRRSSGDRRERRAGRGQAGGLRGHVPSNAAGGVVPPAAARRSSSPRSTPRARPRIVLVAVQAAGHRAAGRLRASHRWLDRLLSRRGRATRCRGTPSTSATARSARSSAGSGTWPPSIAASSTRPTSTNTSATTASRPCGSA